MVSEMKQKGEEIKAYLFIVTARLAGTNNLTIKISKTAEQLF